MRNRDKSADGSPWNEENTRKAFKDRFGLARKEMLAKPLTRVKSATFIRIIRDRLGNGNGNGLEFPCPLFPRIFGMRIKISIEGIFPPFPGIF